MGVTGASGSLQRLDRDGDRPAELLTGESPEEWLAQPSGGSDTNSAGLCEFLLDPGRLEDWESGDRHDPVGFSSGRRMSSAVPSEDSPCREDGLEVLPLERLLGRGLHAAAASIAGMEILGNFQSPRREDWKLEIP
mmetsp:Transcript_57433/g.122170  ORF Transcript_57433/g.122170 Transcript_57433/m.122170 type:complete len:136 (-) Transcript_57433:78-485(-)